MKVYRIEYDFINYFCSLHLAIQHHELRPFMEKDDRLSEDFKKDVYYVSNC